MTSRRNASGTWERVPEERSNFDALRTLRRAAQLDPPDLGPQDDYGPQDDEPP